MNTHGFSGRRPFVAGNWKMFHGGASGVTLAGEIAKGASAYPEVDILVAPPFTALAAVAAEVDGSMVLVGAQTVHPKPNGAFTGEISPPMLIESGAHWVIVGHSERRAMFGETNTVVAAKAEAVLASPPLLPICCVGETLAERQDGKTLEVISTQINALLPVILAGKGTVAIAYEPVWAIGTGHVATPEQAQEVHAAIRGWLADSSADLARATRILYGGSVKADNASILFGCPDVDGALVGGASLDAASFLSIIQCAAVIARNSTRPS